MSTLSVPAIIPCLPETLTAEQSFFFDERIFLKISEAQTAGGVSCCA
nr:hypothetical protein [uncultured Desulfobacter sp.]